MSRSLAAQHATAAAADAATRAATAPAAQAAPLCQASAHWATLANLLVGGCRMPKAWVREHAQAADALAARAGELAPAPCAQAVVDALFPPRP